MPKVVGCCASCGDAIHSDESLVTVAGGEHCGTTHHEDCWDWSQEEKAKLAEEEECAANMAYWRNECRLASCLMMPVCQSLPPKERTIMKLTESDLCAILAKLNDTHEAIVEGTWYCPDHDWLADLKDLIARLNTLPA